MVEISFYRNCDITDARDAILHVRPNHTFAYFKMRVYDKFGDLPWNQRLYDDSQTFNDESTLASLGWMVGSYYICQAPISPPVSLADVLGRLDLQKLSTLLEAELTSAQLIAEGVDYYYMANLFKKDTFIQSLTADQIKDLGIDLGALVHVAARKPKGSACISALANVGANIDARNPRTGETALFVAAAKGRFEVVKTLLSLGADPTTRNAKGTSAVDAARQKRHNNVVKLLNNSIANYHPSSQQSDSPAVTVQQMVLEAPQVQKRQQVSHKKKSRLPKESFKNATSTACITCVELREKLNRCTLVNTRQQEAIRQLEARVTELQETIERGYY